MYQPLTLKYRPQTWADLVGQEVLAQTIKNMLQDNRLYQSLVLGGSRGIGKTTTARILARALNCENRTETYDPCGKCTVCIEILEERSQAVQELDAASNGLVEDVRRIRNEVMFSNASKWRVYIIDECHSLSRQAWDAFLKLLEEPPANVIFVFCTTEVHRVPETIVSRSLYFSFLRMSAETIIKRLSYIALAEEIQIEVDVYSDIARHVNGGMRDAVRLLDQLRSFSRGEKITREHFTSVVGSIGRPILFEIYRSLTTCDVQRLYTTLQRVYGTISDVGTLVADLTLFYRDLMLAKLDVPLLDAQQEYVDSLRTSAQQVTVDYLVEAQNQLHHLGDQIRRSRLPARIVVDVGITRLFYGGMRTTPQVVYNHAVQQVPLPAILPEQLAEAFGGTVLNI